MADTEPGAPVERAFDEFIDQHPASVRLVCWRSGPQQSGTDSQHSGHLEIETKHGQVAVIDHRSGVVYRHPPRPRGTAPEDDRCWRDLTARVPVAFDGRPQFTAIAPRRDHKGTLIAWRFELSTGCAFEFHMHPDHPVLSTDP